jgi:mannose-6-phosphate isomerase-like protein (cupin superfamily)
MSTTIQTRETIIDGPFGVELLVKGEDTDSRFALVEHPIAPHALAGPMHVHAHEDEYSYVLEGRSGFRSATRSSPLVQDSSLRSPAASREHGLGRP